jgi:hypothetical protein
MFLQPETITIRLHTSNKDTRDIVVHPSDPIKVLDQEVKGNEKRFIMFNGNILMTSFSFKFFGVKDGDHLYVLRAPRKQQKQSQKTKNLVQSLKNTYSLVKMGNDNVEIIDRSALRECIRLLDLMYIRDESRPFSHRRAPQEEEIADQDPPKQQTVECGRPIEPSTGSLPIFWSNRKTRMLRPKM